MPRSKGASNDNSLGLEKLVESQMPHTLTIAKIWNPESLAAPELVFGLSILTTGNSKVFAKATMDRSFKPMVSFLPPLYSEIY